MPARRAVPFHRGLDRASVVAGALAVLDREGRPALTMRRVARELDVEAASLYTYVASKDELIDAVLDSVLDEVVVPEDAPTWRTTLVDGFVSYRRTLVAHPAVVSLMTERTRMSTSQVRLIERSLKQLEIAGLSPGDAVSTHITLIAYTLGFVVQEVAPSAVVDRQSLDGNAVLQRALQHLGERSVDDRFLDGLNRILDGVEASLANA